MAVQAEGSDRYVGDLLASYDVPEVRDWLDDHGSKPEAIGQEERRHLKNVRADYTVSFAYEHSDFYQELMDEAGVDPKEITSIHDLGKLPVTTSEDILQNQPPKTDSFRLYNDEAPLRRPFNTSGSSGQPKVIFMSHGDVETYYHGNGARIFENLGVTEEDLMVNYNPFVGLNPSCVFAEGAMEEIGGATLPISNTPYPIDTEAQKLKAHEPDVMMSLPSHADARGK
ncbi:MAG: phenylacetate--CoA ligase family protein, partial [Halobacteriaceae archaeon]